MLVIFLIVGPDAMVKEMWEVKCKNQFTEEVTATIYYVSVVIVLILVTIYDTWILGVLGAWAKANSSSDANEIKVV